MKSIFSIAKLIINADFIVQMVMLTLFLASLWSWAIIFDKIFKFRLLKARSDSFEELFEKDDMMIEDVYAKSKKQEKHPLSLIFIACIAEWKSNNVKKIIKEGLDQKNSLKERLNLSMTIALNQSMQKLEKGLNFLAIIGSIAPFVGLFGTVWGIMNSFQGIAASKNTSLAVVAPGIAEALLATGIGLFAAIPAVFFYNIFTNKINQFNERANNFSMQLSNLLSRELDR